MDRGLAALREQAGDFEGEAGRGQRRNGRRAQRRSLEARQPTLVLGEQASRIFWSAFLFTSRSGAAKSETDRGSHEGSRSVSTEGQPEIKCR
jgi:hypothetical protein